MAPKKGRARRKNNETDRDEDSRTDGGETSATAPANVTAEQLSVLLDTIAKAAETNRVLMERMTSGNHPVLPPGMEAPGATSTPARATPSDFVMQPPGTFAKCTARYDGATASADQLEAFIEAVQIQRMYECIR